jgi:hypothetical protein
MQLTPEQRKQAQAARAAGERRVMLEFTPEQRAEWQASVEQELADKDVNIERFHKRRASEQEPGFLGDLRRAITASRGNPQLLAEQVGIDWRQLSDFRCGETTLPSDVIDRLIAALGLRLMQDIPASQAPPSGRS